MKSWRVLGLVWAVLSLGSMTGCGDGGGGGKSDGGSDGGDYVDRESGIEPGTDAEVDPEDSGGGEDADADVEETLDTGADSGGDEVDACVAKSCTELGYNCGIAKDGCGGDLNCGPEKCSGTVNTCGGGGQVNVCGCTPKTCQEISVDRGVQVCGSVDNGCGGKVQCGGNEVCGANQTCGGAGTADQCGCVQNLLACEGKQCGTASDGCGGTINCGANAGGCGSDAKQCNPQSRLCECKTTDATFCAGKCGIKLLDGCPIDCGGDCGANACPSGGACENCACPVGSNGQEICAGNPAVCCAPEPAATTCSRNYAAACGTRLNNCGQTVQCGSACTDGKQCVENLCITPEKAAMLGSYAMRAEAWVEVIDGFAVSRAEGFSYVTIELNKNPATLGDLVYTEAACGNRAFLGNSPSPAATIGPEVATKIQARPVPMQVPGTIAGLPGPSAWVRDVPAPEDNVGGWRRGRPAYCPLPSPGVPAPGPNHSDPSYAPANDTFALGGKKPWLGQADCLCPEQEIAKRSPNCNAKPAAERAACNQQWCTNVPADQKAACVESWARNVIPWGVSAASPDTDATDCRIIDEDDDDAPAVTLLVRQPPFAAKTRSTTIGAVRYWGAIDLQTRKHFGVSFDQAESRGSNVACVEPEPGQAPFGLLCGAGAGSFCSPYVDGKRSNTLDFVPVPDWRALPAAPGPNDGPCFRIWQNRTSLFTAYVIAVPPVASCRRYGETPGPVLEYTSP